MSFNTWLAFGGYLGLSGSLGWLCSSGGASVVVGALKRIGRLRGGENS